MSASFPIPPEQRVIRTYTGRAEQPIRTIIYNAGINARTAIDLEELARLIAGGASLEALAPVIHVDTMIGEITINLRPLLEDVIGRASAAGELIFAEGLGVAPIDLAIFRREAVEVARRMVGDLIQGIERGRFNPIAGLWSRGQLGIVREIIGEGFDLGRPHRATARLVSEVIGLDDRRAMALAKYARELELAGVPEARRLRLVEAESKRKLLSRGLAVSRTEATRMANKSQDLIWEQGVEAGQIEREIWEQEWVPSPNACPVCQGLRGKRAPIGGQFPAPGGEGPPNPHTHCHCGKRLRRREQE